MRLAFVLVNPKWIILGLFYSVYDCFECFWVIHGQVGEYLTVKVESGVVYFAHEYGVAHTVLTSACVDPLDPEATEKSLSLLAVTVGVEPSFFDLVFGYGPDVFLTTEIAFGELQHFFASRLGSHVIY